MNATTPLVWSGEYIPVAEELAIGNQPIFLSISAVEYLACNWLWNEVTLRTMPDSPFQRESACPVKVPVL